MFEDLENTREQGLRRVVIDPVSRVEGHGRVTLLLDEQGRVRQARLAIVEFRGFEKFIQGRPFWEVPVLVQRLCGICPVSHLLAASKAADAFVLGSGRVPPAADRLRRLLHFAQVLQSHALHFFYLASPDLLFGFEAEACRRNIAALALEHPDVAREGIALRRYGQQLIQTLCGKRIHGTGSLAGGFNKALSRSERDELARALPDVIAMALRGVGLARQLFLAGEREHPDFAAAPSLFLSLSGPQGELELYDGALRVRDAQGTLILDRYPSSRYFDLIREQVKPWSYMKFPFLAALGPELGWYRVGPLARINNCDRIPTPLAEEQRQSFLAFGGDRPVQATLAYHWARMIELLHCAEAIGLLLDDPLTLGTDLQAEGQGLREGIGVIEAPRGTLFHHYRIGDDDLVTMANLIVSTTQNNQAMNESVRAVAAREFDGREISEGLLNRIEVAIRAYDPCLSCATHALGRMPLQVEAVAPDGSVVARLVRNGDGCLEGR